MYNCIVLRHWKRTYLTPQKPIVNSPALCAICFRRYFLPCESSNEFYHPLDEGFWNLFVNRYAYRFPHCFVIIDVATKIKQSSSGDDGLLFMLWELCVDIPRWLQYLKVVFNFLNCCMLLKMILYYQTWDCLQQFAWGTFELYIAHRFTKYLSLLFLVCLLLGLFFVILLTLRWKCLTYGHSQWRFGNGSLSV